MIRTERGRVVYARKKHLFGRKDVRRVVLKYGEIGTWTNITSLFRELFLDLTPREDVTIAEVARMFWDLLRSARIFIAKHQAFLALVLAKSITDPGPGPGTSRSLERLWVEMMQAEITSIEGE